MNPKSKLTPESNAALGLGSRQGVVPYEVMQDMEIERDQLRLQVKALIIDKVIMAATIKISHSTLKRSGNWSLYLASLSSNPASSRLYPRKRAPRSTRRND
jgi:hypothetical protein